MKRNIDLTAAVACIWLVAGCALIAPGSDPIVVNAERTAATAMDVIDTFLHWEYDHRETVPAQAHQIAEAMRVNGPVALETLRNLTKAYKQNRTPENKSNLVTAQAVVHQLVIEAEKWLATKGTIWKSQ